MFNAPAVSNYAQYGGDQGFFGDLKMYLCRHLPESELRKCKPLLGLGMWPLWGCEMGVTVHPAQRWHVGALYTYQPEGRREISAENNRDFYHDGKIQRDLNTTL